MRLGFCVFGAKRSSRRWFGIAQRLRPGTPTGAQLTTGGLKSQTRSESASVFGSIDCIALHFGGRLEPATPTGGGDSLHPTARRVGDVRVVCTIHWYSCAHYSNTTLSLCGERSQVRGQRRILLPVLLFLANSTYCLLYAGGTAECYSATAY